MSRAGSSADKPLTRAIREQKPAGRLMVPFHPHGRKGNAARSYAQYQPGRPLDDCVRSVDRPDPHATTVDPYYDSLSADLELPTAPARQHRRQRYRQPVGMEGFIGIPFAHPMTAPPHEVMDGPFKTPAQLGQLVGPFHIDPPDDPVGLETSQPLSQKVRSDTG